MSVYLSDVPFDEAWSGFVAAMERAGLWAPLPSESVGLDHAFQRVTAEPVWAKISSPHYHAAAMDGYALQASATAGASDRDPVRIELGPEAEYVDTGDPLPDWADAVVPIESVEPVGQTNTGRASQAILLRASVPPWTHVRPIGEDMVATELILPSGHVMRPVDIGAVAGCGHTEIAVRRQPKVVIIPTGSELVPPSSKPQPGQIIEFNSLVLAAQVRGWGGIARRSAIVPDEPDRIQAAVEEAAGEADLILLNAGSSAGAEDFSAAVVEDLGQLLVHGVAIRPGHPVILGMIKENVPIIGVPGYPASAALTGELFVQPLIRRWLGLGRGIQEYVEAILTRKVHSSLGDDEYLRVSVGRVGSRMVAAPLSRGAGVISSLVRADGLVRIPAGTQGHAAGSKVRVSLYRSLAEVERSIVAAGSHDLTLDLLAQELAVNGVRLSSASVGSLGGLVALKREQAHLAGSHLLDPETGEYNVSYVEKQLAGTPVVLVGLVHRRQGLIVARGNPNQFDGLADLTRDDVSFCNRQRGAGTRVLLDFELSKLALSADSIRGYEREEYTHLAAAAAVAAGRANCALGIAAAAQALDLDFVPLYDERYDLVVPTEYYESDLLKPLIEILRSTVFAESVMQLPGYELNRPGQVIAEIG